MKKLLALLLLLATPAYAVDNTVIVTPGTGVTMKSKDIGSGVQAMQPILSDASGNALLTTLGADAVSNTLTGIPVYSRQLFYNGTTWDRWTGAVTVTGGATSALQTTGNTSLGTIATNSGTQATSALQTTGNTSLATIATNSALPLPAQSTRTVNIGEVDIDPSRMASAPIAVSTLATPVNAAFTTATTGGTLAAATYFYRVSATNAAGETLASTETSQATTGTTSTVTVNWGAVTGATGYKVYGRTTGAELLIATVGAVTTYTDTGSVTPSGALPAANTTASSAQIVALSAGQSIYVTSFDVVAAGTSNVTFVYGTGTNCGTGQVALTGAYPLVAQAGLAKGAGIGTVLKVPASNALCVLNSAAITLAGSVSHQQF